jgi:hypothetical protein
MASSTVLLAAVLIGGTTAAILQWRRRNQPARTRVSLGLMLIGFSLILWFSLLDTEDAPRDEPYGLGVVPPARSEEGNGFAAALAVTVDDCGEPVRGTLVIAGTAEFWREVAPRNLPKLAFRVLVPGEVTDVRVGLSDSASDLQRPFRANPLGSARLADPLIEPVQGGTVVSGRVNDWNRTLDPVVIQFEADWLRTRGLYECYLETPALTGPLSAFAAEQTEGRVSEDPEEVAVPGGTLIRSNRLSLYAAYKPEFETTVGQTTVLVRSGQVETGSSLPPPDRTVEGNPAWSCETRPAETGGFDDPDADVLVTPQSRGGAYAADFLRETATTDCAAVATVSLGRAGVGRDIAVLIVGGLLSMGNALLLDALIARLTESRRRRREEA